MRRARIVQLVAKDALRHDGAPKAEKLIALTDDGEIFERFSDEDPGTWHTVQGPAHRKVQKRVERRKR